MAHKEAIQSSTRYLLDKLDEGFPGKVVSKAFFKQCTYDAGVFNVQAGHLLDASSALKDQALDLLIKVNRSLKNG